MASTDIPIPPRVQRAIASHRNAEHKLHLATFEYNAAKELLIAALKDQPIIGSHPAVQHHIINTEERVLTSEERGDV